MMFRKALLFGDEVVAERSWLQNHQGRQRPWGDKLGMFLLILFD